MNWLILHSEKDSAQAKALKEFLKKNEISAADFFAKDDGDFLSAKGLKELEGATHAVFLGARVPQKNEALAWGLLLGKGIPVYALKGEWTDAASPAGPLQAFDGFDALLDFLKKNLDSIAREAKKKAAWARLFESGNPFTGDAMAVHVKKDNRDIVQTYLDAGMSLDERDGDGTPMLNVAIRAEQVDEVKWMLGRDVDLNAVSKDRGYSALMDCVWKKNLELAKILVSKGVNLDFVSSDNQSALVLAVGAGNAEMVRLLSDAGANPDKADALGMTAWTYAKLFKRQDLLSFMEKNHHGQ